MVEMVSISLITRTSSVDALIPNNSDLSVANVTIDREAYPKRWYVAHVNMKCEKKSAQRLADLGYETFVPVQQEIHQWSDRKKKVERVIIPLLVFIKVDEPALCDIERMSFIRSLLRSPGQKKPAAIPDWQMDLFRFMVDRAASPVELNARLFNKGDSVKVVRGPLKGLSGFIALDADGKSRVCINIDSLGCASVEISAIDIEHEK